MFLPGFFQARSSPTFEQCKVCVDLLNLNECFVAIYKCRVVHHCANAEEIEALACQEALQLAVEWIWQPVILENLMAYWYCADHLGLWIWILEAIWTCT